MNTENTETQTTEAGRGWTSKLRSKRVVIPAVAAVAVLAVGSLVWSSAASDNLNDNEFDRASTAAVQAAGGGQVTDSEKDRNGYELEVTREDGTEVDIYLDENFNVTGNREDDRYDDDRDDRDDAGEVRDNDADDRVLSQTERDSATKAALAEIGSGTVTDVEASDDRGTAYEVEVVKADRTEWHVDLNADFGVVSSHQDD